MQTIPNGTGFLVCYLAVLIVPDRGELSIKHWNRGLGCASATDIV
jgi:hypothetical protein